MKVYRKNKSNMHISRTELEIKTIYIFFIISLKPFIGTTCMFLLLNHRPRLIHSLINNPFKGYHHMPIKLTTQMTRYEMIFVSKLASDEKVGMSKKPIKMRLFC
jgi:hypothetical protein